MLDALQLWSGDELRSLNGQIEYLLRQALREAGRLQADSGTGRPATESRRARARDGGERGGKG